MKRIKVLVAIAIITVLTFAGCAKTSENYAYTAEYRDKETGVHYFYTYKGGLTVRINADGTPYVD